MKKKMLYRVTWQRRAIMGNVGTGPIQEVFVPETSPYKAASKFRRENPDKFLVACRFQSMVRGETT